MSFLPTIPYTPLFDDGTPRIRLGCVVPTTAVNLTHYHTKKLAPSENIIIGDYSFAIAENIQQPQSAILRGSDTNQLTGIDGNMLVDSEFIEITDQFLGDVPLYYRYTLSEPFSEDQVKAGVYTGESIQIVDLSNNVLPSTMIYKIVLERDSTLSLVTHDVFKVHVYTSFQIEDGFLIKAAYVPYSALQSQGIHEEYINPQAFFIKADTVLEATEAEERFYIQKSIHSAKGVYIYTKSHYVDNRRPHSIKITLEVTFANQETLTLHYPADYNGQTYFNLYRHDCILEFEKSLYKGTRQMLVAESLETLLQRTDIVGVKAEVDQLTVQDKFVRCYIRSDGKGALYAETLLNTIPPLYLTNQYDSKQANLIFKGYSVRFRDRSPIKLLPPLESDALSPWLVRVQNGRFTKYKRGALCHYYLPEYYRQFRTNGFADYRKKVIGETPQRIGHHLLKVHHAPILVDTKQPLSEQLVVYTHDVNGNKQPLQIDTWHSLDGTIMTKEIVSDLDGLYVDYTYEETALIYKGCTTEDNHYHMLDVNPYSNHYTHSTVEAIGDYPTYHLFHSTLYFYIRPAIIENGIEKITHKHTLFHTTTPLTYDYMNEHYIEHIGIIYVRPSVSIDDVVLTDTRSRGGGLKYIEERLRQTLEIESNHYWDIGYWDGEPYTENGVILVTLDKHLLQENGGLFTREMIEEKVSRHMALGTYAIIDYATPLDEHFILKNLTIKQDYNENTSKETVTIVFERIDNLDITSYEVLGNVKGLQIQKHIAYIDNPIYRNPVYVTETFKPIDNLNADNYTQMFSLKYNQILPATDQAPTITINDEPFDLDLVELNTTSRKLILYTNLRDTDTVVITYAIDGVQTTFETSDSHWDYSVKPSVNPDTFLIGKHSTLV